MNEFATSEVFADGESVSAAILNNAFATLATQVGFVTAKSQIAPAGGDFVVFYDISGAVLGKCTLTQLITALLGTSATTATAGNDTRLPASVTGIRKSAGAGSTDTAAALSDFVHAPNALTLVTGAATGDCTLYDHFTCTLIANATITLTSIPDGGCVYLQTTQDGTGSRTLAFVTAGLTQTKLGGTAAPTAAAGSVDIFKLERFGTQVRITAYNAYA